MSAYNWAVCPKCNIQAVAEKKKARLDAGAAYGKVAPEEYLRLLAAADKSDSDEPATTLREDYEIWTDPEGQFHIHYSAGCGKCGFTFDYEHSQKVPLIVSLLQTVDAASKPPKVRKTRKDAGKPRSEQPV